jgi:hypothetical protein
MSPKKAKLTKRPKKEPSVQSGTSFSGQYPNIDGWVKDGWIEIGYETYTKSFIRVMDEGGTVWEGCASYPSLDDALADADRAIADWIENN